MRSDVSTPGGPSVTVAVADDHAAARGAITAVVGRAAGFELVGEAVSGDALIALVRELRPDIAIADVRMAGIDGIEAARSIAKICPGTVVILVTAGDVGSLRAADDARPAVLRLNKAELTPKRLAQIWSERAIRVPAR